MIFRPELAAKVLAGEKTVTRRLASRNPRSPWYFGRSSVSMVGRSYAVQDGRGRPAIGRIRVVTMELRSLGPIGDAEARLEGFENFEAFRAAWVAINGGWDSWAEVWRLAFVLLRPGMAACALGET